MYYEKPEASINRIEIKYGTSGMLISVTLEEARSIKKALDEIFPAEERIVYVPQPTPAPAPGWYSDKLTCGPATPATFPTPPYPNMGHHTWCGPRFDGRTTSG